jgi:hypothetical protein
MHAEYWGEVPREAGSVIQILRASDLGVWIRCADGQEYLVPHHTRGKATRSGLSIVNKEPA